MIRRILDTALMGGIALAVAALAVAARPSEEPPAETPAPASARTFYERAMGAYQRKDYLSYLENIEKALELAPDQPALIFRMAGASALVGNEEAALAHIRRLAAMKIFEDIRGNADFQSLQGSAEFASLAQSLKTLKDRVGTSQTAFHLAEKDLIPEGLAHDPGSGDFFVGSVHKRKIVRVSRRGKAKDFAAGRQDGLWAVLGMKVDAPRRLLWVCTSALPQMQDPRAEDLGRAALFKYDIDTAALVGRYPLGGGATGHNCNDLTVDARGDVFVSDAGSSEILTLAASARDLSVLIPAGTLKSPQGLAFTGDGRYLFIADYGAGIYRMDAASRSLAPVAHPPEVCLLGIDGLAFFNGSLVAVQNGIAPHRVVRLGLDADALTVRAADILEMSNALFDEPTLGVVAGKSFYYVANSQWGRFDKDGRIHPIDRLAEPAILKLRID